MGEEMLEGDSIMRGRVMVSIKQKNPAWVDFGGMIDIGTVERSDQRVKLLNVEAFNEDFISKHWISYCDRTVLLGVARQSKVYCVLAGGHPICWCEI